MKTPKRLLASFALLMLIFTSAAVPAEGATKTTDKKATTETTQTSKNEDISDAVTQSYNADKSVQVGMIVQLNVKDSTTVLPAVSKDAKHMHGVVIPVSNAPIVLAPKSTKDQQVLVATNGRHQVIVSNQNGPIKVGDYISISAIDGVGMKANPSQEQVLGKAAADFSGTSNVIGTVKLKDTLGKEAAVSLSRIAIDINVTHNPLSQQASDYVPGFLAKAAISVANKPVSVARIYLCTILIIMTAIISGNMLYSGVRSGMIAVGRNPLSKKSIIKSLIQTVIAGMIVFFIGVLAVYLLLKL